MRTVPILSHDSAAMVLSHFGSTSSLKPEALCSWTPPGLLKVYPLFEATSNKVTVRGLVLGTRHGDLDYYQVVVSLAPGFLWLCSPVALYSEWASRVKKGHRDLYIWCLGSACGFPSTHFVVHSVWSCLHDRLHLRLCKQECKVCLLCSPAPAPFVSKIADWNSWESCLQMFIILKNPLLFFILKSLGWWCFVLARLAWLTQCLLQCSTLCVICNLPQEQWWPLRHCPSPTA